MPVTEPIDLAVEQSDKGVISATPPTRRAVGGVGIHASAAMRLLTIRSTG